MARMRQIAGCLDDSAAAMFAREPVTTTRYEEPAMLNHPLGCACQRCAPPIVLDGRRITLGFLGLCIVLGWLWLTWIALPA
ncbi:hypothetical protein [Sphingomonas liriopis]|nr:hypothetical protein [Sphingomonas liriopis]